MTDDRRIDLSGGVAVITGAAGGIGLGLARATAERGMRVVLADLDAERAEASAELLRAAGAEAVATGCDVRSLDDLARLRDLAASTFGPVDLLCCNAGIGLVRPIDQCTADDWRLLIDVNVIGVANTVQTFLPAMIERRRGHVTATASLAGLAAEPGLAIYSATKHAVVGLLEGLGLDMRTSNPGITTSVLCPGPVATDLIESSARVLTEGGSDSTSGDEVAAYLARGMHPDEVGRVAIDGIERGRFWLLPHGELTDEVLATRAAAIARGDLTDPEGDWTDQ